MENVTVIGLGLMGSALAEAFVKKPLAVTVWNRSAARTGRLKTQGAQVAATVEEAIASSDVILVSLSNHSAAREVLGAEAAARALKGKTPIQLSSGTTKEGRDAAEWAHEHGVKYLDGAILAYPQHIGTAAADFRHGMLSYRPTGAGRRTRRHSRTWTADDEAGRDYSSGRRATKGASGNLLHEGDGGCVYVCGGNTLAVREDEEHMGAVLPGAHDPVDGRGGARS
jgi:saccharopine dehydrogenase-like NADP-dependent oxidoreductase